MTSIYRATPLVLALAAALQLSTTACATSAPMAQTPTEVEAQSTGLPTMDQQFLGEAGKFSDKSIQLAQMAKGSASDDELRAFAGYLESQHIEIKRGIDSVAGGVRAFDAPATVPGGQHGDATQGDNVMPSTPTVSNDPDMARLATLSGPAFDRAWVQLMIDRHSQAITAYRNAEQHGQAEVRGLASRDLVVIRRHLQQLETFEKRLPIIAG